MKQKSSRGPKFDGDAKQTLEIRVKRKRNSRSQKLEEVVSFKKGDLKKIDMLGNRTQTL